MLRVLMTVLFITKWTYSEYRRFQQITGENTMKLTFYGLAFNHEHGVTNYTVSSECKCRQLCLEKSCKSLSMKKQAGMRTKCHIIDDRKFGAHSLKEVPGSIVEFHLSSYHIAADWFPAKDGYFYFVRNQNLNLEKARETCESKHQCPLAIARTKGQLQVLLEISKTHKRDRELRIDLTSSDGKFQWGDEPNLSELTNPNDLDYQSDPVGNVSYIVSHGAIIPAPAEEKITYICSCNLMNLEKPLM